MTYSVLFVCRQNRFRSPMAAALLRIRLKGSTEEHEWLVDSAGTWTQEGQPAVSGVVNEMAVRGLDISQHRTRQVSRAMLAQYQLILTMEQTLHEALCLEFRELGRRIFLLSEVVGETFDITDLDGAAMAHPKQVANEIDSLLERGFENIKKLAEEK
jgi:protein-tyrosine-phosphatase